MITLFLAAKALLLGNWRALAIGLAVGVISGASGTWWLRDQMAAHSALSQAHETIRTITRQGAVTTRVETRYVTRAAQVREVTRNIIQEVPHVVTVEVDRSYGSVPVGFVRLFDAGARGVPAVPDPAGRADDAPSGTALSAVLATTIENDGTCHLNAEQQVALQDWITAQSRLH